MGYRSTRDNRTEDDTQSSGTYSTTEQTTTDTTSTETERAETTAQQSASHRATARSALQSGSVSVGRQRSVERLQQHYGIEIPNRDVLQRLVHTERAYGERVHDWIDEGMPVSILGNRRAMATFRDRQADRPAEVPTDIERQNEYSLQRNRRAGREPSPAGETNVPESVREVISSPGRALDPEIQHEMEQRMGDSFEDVRIHTGAKAISACESINDRAFTVGNHIAFNHGEYDPSAPPDQRVLAHELAHVRQQTGGAVSLLPQADLELQIDPDPALEREAEEAAQQVMDAGTLGIQRMRCTDVHVQRTRGDRDEMNTAQNETRKRPKIEVEYKRQSDTEISFPKRQILSKFKHADDFGVEDTWNMKSKKEFEAALKAHTEDSDTIIIEGKLDQKPATHYYNEDTKNVVITKPDGRFWSCWNLSPAQEKNLITTGEIGGR